MKNNIFLLFFLLLPAAASAQKADDILGKWLSEDGTARFEIFKVSDKYYGKIAWLKVPNDESGNPKTDKNNPDVSKRNNKILGLMLLKSFTFDGEAWTDGTIYDPKNGKDYSCRMTMNENGSLNIRGYIGVSLLGRTTVWTRAE